MTDPAREQVRATIRVSGQVQGVFFRHSAQQEAMGLGLLGEICNLPDGSVEATVEGERRAIDDFAGWCRQGPPSARVERVDLKLSAPRGEFRTFMIVR
jgi:acylphosphatase